jgi:hypothetical protein
MRISGERCTFLTFTLFTTFTLQRPSSRSFIHPNCQRTGAPALAGWPWGTGTVFAEGVCGFKDHTDFTRDKAKSQAIYSFSIQEFDVQLGASRRSLFSCSFLNRFSQKRTRDCRFTASADDMLLILLGMDLLLKALQVQTRS